MKVFSSGKFLVLFVFVMIFSTDFLFAQELSETESVTDPASYVGLTLEALFAELGMPTSVHAVRGNESWQDDVVFVYPNIEVYIFKDRVWQICPVSIYNMKMSDSIDQVKIKMGEPLIETEKYLLYKLPSQAWPMMMRINLNEEKLAASFFLYRSDF
jgi:hypothetical protein